MKTELLGWERSDRSRPATFLDYLNAFFSWPGRKRQLNLELLWISSFYKSGRENLERVILSGQSNTTTFSRQNSANIWNKITDVRRIGIYPTKLEGLTEEEMRDVQGQGFRPDYDNLPKVKPKHVEELDVAKVILYHPRIIVNDKLQSLTCSDRNLTIDKRMLSIVHALTEYNGLVGIEGDIEWSWEWLVNREEKLLRQSIDRVSRWEDLGNDYQKGWGPSFDRNKAVRDINLGYLWIKRDNDYVGVPEAKILEI